MVQDRKAELSMNNVLEYLQLEILGIGDAVTHEPDSIHSARHTIKNFFLTPLELEKFIAYGTIVAFDSFLYVLTYLPVRMVFCFFLLIKEIVLYFINMFKESPTSLSKKPKKIRTRYRLHRSNLYDLLRGIVLLIGYGALCQINMSQLYHFIRGQNMIKLYVLTAMMEVTDTLLASFGQDAFDSLYSQVRYNPFDTYKLVSLYFVVTVYVVLHSGLYFLHVATLTVVINSADSALVTVLILNNFAELRGFVFKKYDKIYLFQLTCVDITERFRILLYLGMIIAVALAQAGPQWKEALPPLLRVGTMMLAGELLADSMKHAFITKFNSIDVSVYLDYAKILRGDFLTNQKDKIILDHTYSVTRRIGLSQIPLGCVCLRCINLVCAPPLAQMYFNQMTGSQLALICISSFIVLVILKLILGVALYLHARNVDNEEKLNGEKEPPPGSPKGRERSNSELVKLKLAERAAYIKELSNITRFTVYKGRVV